MKTLFNRLTHFFAQLLFSLAKALVEKNKLFKTVRGERVAMGFYLLAQNQF